MSKVKWTDGMIAELLARKEQGHEYSKIAKDLSKLTGHDLEANAVRLAYQRYQHLAETSESHYDVKVLKEIARVKRTNSQRARENRVILDHLNSRDDLLDQIKELVKEIPKQKLAVKPATKMKADRPNVTMEMLVSDVHVGKLTPQFNLAVCRARLQQYTELALREIERKQAHYNVERIVLNFMGDEIENALMHGVESMRGCEFSNPEQVRHAIDLFYHLIVLPLAQLGIPMDIHCVPGNHSREGEKKTYQDPGKNSFSWIIYQVMKMLTEKAGLKHLKWTIPEGVYVVYTVYGANYLIEHGDFIKGSSKQALLSQIASRSAQLGIVIHGIRVGHWHEYSCYDNGRAIVNGSVCGGDSFSDVLGYATVPVQVITWYVDTKHRDTPYYYSLPCYLNAGAAT